MDFDDAYANAAYIPGAAAYPERWRQNAAEFRDGLLSAGQAELDITYGQSTRSCLDLFLPDKAPRGLLIFVHGGYWLKFDKSYWSHLAAGPLHHGWAVAMPSYDLCPEVTIAQITRQIVQAIICAAGRVDGGLVLSGHSAGGHLVARMLAPGMLPNAVMQRVQRAVPISPVADLRPLLQTAMNAQFGMDAAQAAAESPVLQQAPKLPVTVWVGAEERPVFLDQARWLVEAWQTDPERPDPERPDLEQTDVGHVVSPGQHHFNVIEDMAHAQSALTTALLA
jgi:acetyl esterase/lipase